MNFFRRSSATSAADVVDDARSFPDPPSPLTPHGDSMQVIPDALVSQLQEIIVAKLAKIVLAKIERTCETTGDQKSEPQETTGEAKKSPLKKWSCAICHVEATSAGNLLQHFSGQKHWANVDALKAEARKSRKAKQGAEQTCPPWTCRFCQAKCTAKCDLENHLKGKKHRTKIQALLEECENMTRDSASSSEVDSYSSNTSQDEEEPASESVCCICQVKWYCQSVMEDHLRGKKHRNNFQALQLEAKRLRIIQQQMTTKQETQQWDCSICQVRCNSETQFQDHCGSRGHMQMEKALYFCMLCNLQCNSAKMLTHHQAGRKHQAKLCSI